MWTVHLQFDLILALPDKCQWKCVTFFSACQKTEQAQKPLDKNKVNQLKFVVGYGYNIHFLKVQRGKKITDLLWLIYWPN